MDKEDVTASEDDQDAALEPEEQEAKWIERANKIFVDDFPSLNLEIPEEYEERWERIDVEVVIHYLGLGEIKKGNDRGGWLGY